MRDVDFQEPTCCAMRVFKASTGYGLFFAVTSAFLALGVFVTVTLLSMLYSLFVCVLCVVVATGLDITRNMIGLLFCWRTTGTVIC